MEQVFNIDTVSLDVKWTSQLSNALFPYSTCGTTCVSMYLTYLAKWRNLNCAMSPDDVFKKLNSPELITKAKWRINHGDDWIQDFLRYRLIDGKVTQYTFLNNVSACLADVASAISGLNFQIEYLTMDEIKQNLFKGLPSIISGKLTSGGHYVLATGYNLDSLVINDPYGNWIAGYANDHNGHNMHYPTDKLAQVLQTEEGKYITIGVKI